MTTRTYKDFKPIFQSALEAHTNCKYRHSLIFWREVRNMWYRGLTVDEAVRRYCGETMDGQTP